MPLFTDHTQWSRALQHSGVMGMKWGYTDGSLNGKRTAQGEEESSTKSGELKFSGKNDYNKSSSSDRVKHVESQVDSKFTGVYKLTCTWHSGKSRGNLTTFYAVENGKVVGEEYKSRKDAEGKLKK